MDQKSGFVPNQYISVISITSVKSVLSCKGLLALEGDLKGDYFPLAGSRSYEPKPTGMSHEKEEALRNNGNLFQEPDSTLLLSSGEDFEQKPNKG